MPRRLGILGILLIVTGIFSLSYWLIVFVGLLWTFVIPLYVATVGFVSSSVFLALVSIVLGKNSVKRVRGIRMRRKLEFAKCKICDASLPETTSRGFLKAHAPHYETLHPEAWAWNLKARKRWLVAQTILVIYWAGWVAASAYEFYRGYLLLPVLMLVPGIFSMFLLDEIKKRKLDYFRDEWARRI